MPPILRFKRGLPLKVKFPTEYIKRNTAHDRTTFERINKKSAAITKRLPLISFVYLSSVACIGNNYGENVVFHSVNYAIVTDTQTEI